MFSPSKGSLRFSNQVVLWLVFLGLAGYAFATSYTVKSGGGGNFTTMAACATQMSTNGTGVSDTCTVFAGTYNESVTIPAGSAGNLKIFTVNGSDVVSGPRMTMSSFTSLLGNCPAGQYNHYGTCGFSLGTASGSGACVTAVSSSTNVTVANNVVESCGSSGINLGGTSTTDQWYIGGSTIAWACTPQFTGVSASMSGGTATFTGTFSSTSVANNYVYATGFSVAAYNNVYWLISAMTSTTITATASGVTGLASATGGTIFRNNACTAALINGTHNLIENNDISHSSDGFYMGGVHIALRGNNFHDWNGKDCNTANTGNNCHIDPMQVDGSGLSPTSEAIQFVMLEGNTVANMVSSGPVSGSGTHCIGLFQNQASTSRDHGIVRFHTCKHIDGGGLFDDTNDWANLKTYNNSYPDISRTLNGAGELINTFFTGTSSTDINDIFYFTVPLSNFNTYACQGTSCTTFTFGHSLAFCTTTPCTIHGHAYGSGSWTSDTGNLLSDPLFVNYGADNFSLQPTSPARNAGANLTTVNGSITGSTSLVVADVAYFQDGWGITNAGGSTFQADCIKVTSLSNPAVCISSINYATNTITLASPISATNGDPVYLYSKSDGTVVQTDTGVDMGAFPFQPSASGTDGGQGFTLNGATVSKLQAPNFLTNWFPVKIDIYRLFETDRSITSRLTLEGQQFCFALEPSRLHPVHVGHPAIPCGVFRVKLTHSPHLGYVTPELLDVPGRSAIRIHIGNQPEDSLGCTLVGEAHGPQPDWVSGSKHAFERLMVECRAAETRGEEITAEYHDEARQP